MYIVRILLDVLLVAQLGGMTVDDVMVRYEEALGGSDAIHAIESIEMFGSVQGLGLSGNVHSIQKAPDLVAERVDIGPLSYEWSYSGDHGWIRDQSGSVRMLSQSELEELLILSKVGGGSSLDELRPHMKLDPNSTTEDQICIRVSKNTADIRLFFSRHTGLLERLSMTKLGMPMEASFYDYRTVDGVVLPFKSAQSIADAFSLEMTVDSIAVNIPVDKTIFQTPADLLLEEETMICDVPMEFETHIVVPVKINEEQGRFFLDSGAGMSCIDESLARSLQLDVEGGLPAQGILGFDSVGVTTIDSLGIGCFILEDPTLASVDLHSFRTSDGGGVEGLLGYDFFSRFKIGFFDDDTLVVAESGGDLDAADYERIPLEFVANVPVVEGEVSGTRGKFMIDTGNAFELILYTPFMEKAELDHIATEDDYGSATGIGGSNTVSMISVDTLSVGPIHIPDVQALYSPEGFGVAGAREAAGNIGIGLLKRFDWMLDYRSGTLFIKKK